MDKNCIHELDVESQYSSYGFYYVAHANDFKLQTSLQLQGLTQGCRACLVYTLQVAVDPEKPIPSFLQYRLDENRLTSFFKDIVKEWNASITKSNPNGHSFHREIKAKESYLTHVFPPGDDGARSLRGMTALLDRVINSGGEIDYFRTEISFLENGATEEYYADCETRVRRKSLTSSSLEMKVKFEPDFEMKLRMHRGQMSPRVQKMLLDEQSRTTGARFHAPLHGWPAVARLSAQGTVPADSPAAL